MSQRGLDETGKADFARKAHRIGDVADLLDQGAGHADAPRKLVSRKLLQQLTHDGPILGRHTVVLRQSRLVLRDGQQARVVGREEYAAGPLVDAGKQKIHEGRGLVARIG